MNESRLWNKISGDFEIERRVEGTVRILLQRKLGNGGVEVLWEIRPTTLQTGSKITAVSDVRKVKIMFAANGSQTLAREDAINLVAGESGLAYDALLKMLQVLSYGIPSESARAQDGVLEWQGAADAGGHSYSARSVGGAEIVSWYGNAGELPGGAFIYNGNCIVLNGAIYAGTFNVTAWMPPQRLARTITLRAARLE